MASRALCTSTGDLSLSIHFPCHITLSIVCVHAKSFLSCLTLCNPRDPMEPSRLLCPWNYPGKNSGEGSHALLQGIFPTQESNLHLLWLLHCKQIIYHWATKEAPLLSMVYLHFLLLLLLLFNVVLKPGVQFENSQVENCGNIFKIPSNLKFYYSFILWK